MKIVNLLIAIFLTGIISGAATPGEDPNKELIKVINQYTEDLKALDPFFAPYFNREDDFSKFGDYLSDDFKNRQIKIVENAQGALKKVDKRKLDKRHQTTFELFNEDLVVSREGLTFPNEYLSLNQKGSRLNAYLDDSSPNLSSYPYKTVKHYLDFIERAKGFPVYVDRQIAVLEDGLKKGYALNCIVAGKVKSSYEEALKKDDNPFLRPLKSMSKEFSSDDKNKIQSGFNEMVKNQILPGYEKFDEYFQKKYLPKCRKSFGLGDLPNGKKWYNYQIKANSNTDLSANQIHNIGLKEVARIKSEMEKVKDRLGFKGSFAQFLKHMVDDPSSYFKDPKEAIESYQAVRQNIDKAVPRYFNLRPKTDYKLVEAENPQDAAASYRVPTELLEYGRFVVNTLNLKGNTKLEVTTLSLHEAVPGHHFQLALAYEMKERLTEYQRKIFDSTAFVEGWALYAEYLGREMGLFKDDNQYFGHLSAEMLRAVRLVLDTGIHAKGWSHQKSVDYMKQYVASDISDIISEVERYSVWPGQALGYKIGQLKIIELREKAQKKLGNKFDIKNFHDVVLGEGTVSLKVLEKRVNQWISEQLAENKIKG